MKLRDIAARLREIAAEAERLTNELDAKGQKQYPRGLGHMLGSVEALAATLEHPDTVGAEQCRKCKRFLSTTRVAMRIPVCSRCAA